MNASDLLAAYHGGSDQAFTDLIRRYANLVFSVAKRRLGDSAAAEDVAQVVFTRLAKSPPRVSSDGELVAWLHRTTVHAAIDFWRGESRRRNREQACALMQSTSAEDSRIWEELSPHLDKALDALNDAERQAVLLRFFEGRPMREIGRILGVSEDAAKMRVSRGVERLREQLSLSGATCTVAALAALLPQHSVEAAPAHVLVRLGTIRHGARAAPGAGLLASLMPSLLKSPMFLRAALLVGLGTVAFVLFRNFTAPPKALNSMSEASAQAQTPTTPATGASRRLPIRRGVLTDNSTPATAQPETKFTLRVVERGTSRGLAGAQIRAPYFYAGGVGERHELETDALGYAAIPRQDHPDRAAGMNMFVSAAGYVPLCVSFGSRIPREQEYLLELDPAQTVGGIVVDEAGAPVPGVLVEAERQEDYKDDAPNTDFQTTKPSTDPNGRWIYPYVPPHYKRVLFRLTCTNYMVTHASVVTGDPELLNAVLVIKRGYAVTGRVTDTAGRAVAGAMVKELHEYGYRQLSSGTDANGEFALRGIASPSKDTVELVVQADGLAPQVQTVRLVQPTNDANFVLAQGCIFRGRVVDDAGQPIVLAAVRTDYDFKNQIAPRFEWLTNTDAQGRFEWNSAPPEKICFWFEADGYEEIRGQPMLADGTDHEIRLRRKASHTEEE